MCGLSLYPLKLEFRKEQFDAIATQLRHNQNSKLQVLHLNYHRLCRVSFEQFMKTLSLSHVIIRDLEIRSLHFVADECLETQNQGFAQALGMLKKHNYTIQSLSVNTATKQQKEQLDLYLRLNIAGRSKLRNPKMTPMEWISILESNSHDTDVTRHLLEGLSPILFRDDCKKADASNRTNGVDEAEDDLRPMETPDRITLAA